MKMHTPSNKSPNRTAVKTVVIKQDFDVATDIQVFPIFDGFADNTSGKLSVSVIKGAASEVTVEASSFAYEYVRGDTVGTDYWETVADGNDTTTQVIEYPITALRVTMKGSVSPTSLLASVHFSFI